MPAQAPADVAVVEANALMSICQQIRNLQTQIQGLLAYNAASPLGTPWSALNTAATASDGQLGTADGSPNTSHIIDTRVYPLLNRAVSETQLVQALQIVVDFNAFCAGTAVGANAARPAQLNAVVT